MKILYVINSFDNGGAELGLATLVENGFFAGHEVTLCALVEGSGNVRLRLEQAVGEQCVKALCPTARLRNGHLALVLYYLARLLGALRPDVLILSLPQANLVGRLASLAAPRPVIVAFEHSITYRRRSAYYLLKATGRLVDQVFYDHAETWAAVRRLFPGLPDDAAHNVPLTVLETRSEPPLLPASRWRLLHTGRLSREKNQGVLIHAVRQLVDRGRDVTLTIAGDGPLHQELTTLVEQLELTERVCLTGFVENVGALRSASDIYVQPSLREGLCLAVLEAMAAGMLTIASDIGGMRQYGRHGENMLKLAAPTAESVVEAVEHLIAMGPAARLLQGSAIATIDASFSASSVLQTWKTALFAVERAAWVKHRERTFY